MAAGSRRLLGIPLVLQACPTLRCQCSRSSLQRPPSPWDPPQQGRAVQRTHCVWRPPTGRQQALPADRCPPPPPPPCLPLCPYRRPRKRAQPGCARPAVLSKLRWVARGRVVGGGPSSSGAQSGALRPAVHTALPCAALRLPRVRAHPLAATGLHSLASRLQARTCTTWHASLPPPHGTPPLARRRCGGALGLGIWGWCSACGTHAAPLLLGAAPPAGRGRGGGVLPRLRRRHAAFMQRTQPAPIHSKPY